jgi:salicylate hydroxylase
MSSSSLPISGPLFTFHRADFQSTLLRHLPPATQTHCAKRLQSYTQHSSGSGVDLVFEDGTMATCDVLIGADGVKSVVRKGLLTELSEARAGPSSIGKDWKEKDDILGAVNPSWTGTFAYRALIPGDKLRAKDPKHRALTGQNQVSIFRIHVYLR